MTTETAPKKAIEAAQNKKAFTLTVLDLAKRAVADMQNMFAVRPAAVVLDVDGDARYAIAIGPGLLDDGAAPDERLEGRQAGPAPRLVGDPVDDV